MKKLVIPIVIIPLLMVVCCANLIVMAFGAIAERSPLSMLQHADMGCANNNPVPAGNAPNPDDLANGTGFKTADEDWNGAQVRNAAIIVQVGRARGLAPRAWVIAVATAMQESKLLNLASNKYPETVTDPRREGDVGRDHDSVGLFQQRPQSGWGQPLQLLDKQYASTKFYEKLVTVANWQTLPLTEAAQEVQRSAYPDAYAKWEDDAKQLVEHAAGLPPTFLTDNQNCTFVAHCGALNKDVTSTVGTISAQGWTQPLPGDNHVSSAFRSASRPDHDGVDIMADKCTPIFAASAGEVVTMQCDAQERGVNCDIDGSPSTPGCGWYVKIKHGSNLWTMYCHMIQQPLVQIGQQVQAGQMIGLSGTSGNSSGPHLHFQTHIDNAFNAGAVNPVGFMADRGAPLG